MLVSAAGAAAALVMLTQVGPGVPQSVVALFMVHFFHNALTTLTVGPVCSELASPTLT